MTTKKGGLYDKMLAEEGQKFRAHSELCRATGSMPFGAGIYHVLDPLRNASRAALEAPSHESVSALETAMAAYLDELAVSVRGYYERAEEMKREHEALSSDVAAFRRLLGVSS